MNKFTEELISKLSEKIPEDQLKTVLQEVQILETKFDIYEKDTSIVPYSNPIPDCYRIYMITKKLEGRSIETLVTYNCCLKDFFYNINKELKLITTNDIRKYLYDLPSRTKKCARTVDSCRVMIHGFLEWCVFEQYLDFNPCSAISPINYSVKPRNPLTDYELEVVRDSLVTYRQKALVEFIYSTGCRVSEVASCKLSDVNLNTCEVNVKGKGDKYRTVYLNAKAKLMIERYLETRNDSVDALFVTERKPYKSMATSAIRFEFNKISEQANIGRKVHPHLLRHTMATIGISRGMSIIEMKEILGHVKTDTTLIYAKISKVNVKFNHNRFIS